jgi:YHS domain-containing protein
MSIFQNTSRLFTLSAVMLLLAGVGPALAEEAVQSRSAGDIYPLDTCPVSDGKLGGMGDPVVKEYDGREVRFCCDGCIATFEAKKDEYWKKIDAAIVAQQKPLYPLDTCMVTGQKLGSMGEPVEYVYKNRLIRFCCAGCIDAFKKDPAKYLATLDKAVVEKQKAGYPTDKCVVDGKALGDTAVNYVTGNRLVRLCGVDCVKAFEKDPQKYLSALNK